MFATSALASETVIYTYDELGRLVRTSQTGTVNNGVVTDIDYDPAGNRTDYDVAGSNGSGTDGGATGTPGSGGGGTPPSFSINDASAVEGGSLTFSVTKSGSTSQSYSVNWASANGTALAGSDYNAGSGVLTFSPSQASQNIVIPTIDNGTNEPTEVFYINLSAASGGAAIPGVQGAGTISDNDAPNSPPNAVADASTVRVCESRFVNVVANDTDPDGDYPLTLVAVGTSSKGDVWISSGSDIGFSAYGSTGGTVISYTVQDSRGAQSNGTLGMQVLNGSGCN